MTCPSTECLAGFAAGDLGAGERASVDAHLAGRCEACERELARFAQLRRLASPDVLEDPPPWVLQRAASIPAEAGSGTLSRFLGTIAGLVFDSLVGPLPTGARTTATSGRQLLYRALDYDVDLRLDHSGADGYRVAGQVLPGVERQLDAVASVDVVLTRQGRAVAVGSTNEIGEFAFESLGEGTYTIAIDVREETLLIEGIVIKSA
jgi:hypothetical protein